MLWDPLIFIGRAETKLTILSFLDVFLKNSNSPNLANLTLKRRNKVVVMTNKNRLKTGKTRMFGRA